MTARDEGEIAPADNGAKVKPAGNWTEAAPPAEKRADTGKKPTLDEWRALYEAATAFKDARCWEWMHDNDLFGVMNPETGEIAYCCIMGELGEQYAAAAARPF